MAVDNPIPIYFSSIPPVYLCFDLVQPHADIPCLFILRKTPPLLEPLGPVLKNILEQKPTDMPFQQSFSEPSMFPLDGRSYLLTFTVDVDDSFDSLGGVRATSLSSNYFSGFYATHLLSLEVHPGI
jgi:hypothetical protein